MNKIEQIKAEYHNTINLYKITDKHKEHLHLLTDGLIEDLEPYIKTPKDELLIELGGIVLENSISFDCVHIKESFRMWDIINKLRELK